LFIESGEKGCCVELKLVCFGRLCEEVRFVIVLLREAYSPLNSSINSSGDASEVAIPHCVPKASRRSGGVFSGDINDRLCLMNVVLTVCRPLLYLKIFY